MAILGNHNRESAFSCNDKLTGVSPLKEFSIPVGSASGRATCVKGGDNLKLYTRV